MLAHAAALYVRVLLHGIKGSSSSSIQVLYCLPSDELPKPVDTPANTAIMKLALFFIPLMAVFTPASSVTVTYSDFYDISVIQTNNTVLCGRKLAAANYTTFGSIPGYPNIGGASDITEDDAACGACRQLTYTVDGKPNSIYFAVIDGDKKTDHVTLSSEAYRNLTQLTGPTSQPTSITATVGYVDQTLCGFPPNVSSLTQVFSFTRHLYFVPSELRGPSGFRTKVNHGLFLVG